MALTMPGSISVEEIRRRLGEAGFDLDDVELVRLVPIIEGHFANMVQVRSLSGTSEEPAHAFGVQVGEAAHDNSEGPS